MPGHVSIDNAESKLQEIFENIKSSSKNIQDDLKQSLAISVAKAGAIPVGKALSNDEMQGMVDQLFACQVPNFSPEGKSIIQIVNMDEIDNKFK